MTLSEELQWRGFVNQTTFQDLSALDGDPITFYWGVDPSASSMTIGNFAMAMMVRHFIDHGHKAILLVGGATGLIGDPDGKADERDLKTLDEVAANKAGIAAQYKKVFAGKDFEIVDNYDWFQGLGYLEFLRDVGKHVPMRQMLGREFVQSRLGEDGAGISYAEFSYSLIQGYDFLHLFREKGATLQVAGSDQWGNSIAGVELIRRIAGGEAHVWTGPLVVNKSTGVKFGKSESGAIWLDSEMTSPTQFYQFWINCDDAGVEDYLKIFTTLDQNTITETVINHENNPGDRYAQRVLAHHVTALVHGQDAAGLAEEITDILTGRTKFEIANERALEAMKQEVPYVRLPADTSIVDVLVESKLATSRSEARRLVEGRAVSINGKKCENETIKDTDFTHNYLLVRRGKAYKDSVLVEKA